MLDIEILRMYCDLVELRSFSKAAEKNIVSQSAISQQLAVLRLSGLVTRRTEGGEVVYSLSLPAVKELLAAAREILQTKAADQGGLVDDITPVP